MKLDWTLANFYSMTGRYPEQDDMERLNCSGQGEAGHMFCGYCNKHRQPRFICGCAHYIEHGGKE